MEKTICDACEIGAELKLGLNPTVALRPPPVADKGSKSAAQNKECHEFVLRTSETTIFWAGVPPFESILFSKQTKFNH